MTRSREEITQQTIDELKQKIAAANGNQAILQELLVAELKLQEEADWFVVNSNVLEAVDNLQRCAEKYASSAEYDFVSKWGEYEESFPSCWHKFVSNFMMDMNASERGKIIFELEYDLGLVARPLKESGLEPDESGVEHEQRLAEEQERNTAAAIATMKQFKTETVFWSDKNLCKLFTAYLATLPNVAKLSTDSRLVNVRNVLDKLVDKVLIDGCELSIMFNEYVKALELVMGHHQSSDKKRENERIYLEVRKIYDDLAWLREQNDELAKVNEWRRVHQVVVAQSVDSKLYKSYVSEIESLYRLVCSATSKLTPALPKIHIARYLSGGVGIGMAVGSATMLGLVLSGALTAAVPVLVTISFLIVATVATISGLLGLILGKSLASSGVEISVGQSATETASVIKKACSTAIYALFLGCTATSFAADVIEPTTSAEQQSSKGGTQDDAKDEAELSSSPGTKRFG